MKAVVYEDVKQIKVDDVPDPEIEHPADAIVRITTAGICGSDLHFYHGKAPLMPGETIGHEAVGVVEETGPEAGRFRQGDRVVVAFNIACGHCWFCQQGQTSLCEEFRNLGAGMFGGGLGGAQAERVRVPNADLNLLSIPEGIEDERALFVGDILTTAYYGAAIAGIEPGDSVAVVGAGPVGFLTVQAALLHDPKQVLALDMDEARLALVEKAGGVPVHVKERNPQMAVSDLTDGRGADVVIEAVGNTSAYETAFEVVRRGGRICVLGMFVSESIEIPLGVYWARMLRIQFAGITPVHTYWDQAMEAVRDGRIDPLPIISHTLPLNEAPKGYELFAAREATKVVLKP
ncbi:MAG TPA: alcohol dehydrogenase catalytic domain-containing protein [Actinomycetota bacterium]|nr:alcohol dehydrogenase catalytic domain-containing protein [Actinomycetota bacterium]